MDSLGDGGGGKRCYFILALGALSCVLIAMIYVDCYMHPGTYSISSPHLFSQFF